MVGLYVCKGFLSLCKIILGLYKIVLCLCMVGLYVFKGLLSLCKIILGMYKICLGLRKVGVSRRKIALSVRKVPSSNRKVCLNLLDCRSMLVKELANARFGRQQDRNFCAILGSYPSQHHFLWGTSPSNATIVRETTEPLVLKRVLQTRI